jgi:hypothetical protein
MYVVVFCNEGPDSGLVYMSRKLSDDELLSESAFADRVAGSLGFMIAPDDGHIPNCCGDIRVEFLDHEPRISGERYQGSSVIWSGKSYYFATE